jgi:hypothetical protein
VPGLLRLLDKVMCTRLGPKLKFEYLNHPPKG